MTEDTAEVALVSMICAALLLLTRSSFRDIARGFLRGQRADGELCGLLILTFLSMVAVPFIDVLVPWFEFADLPFLDELAVLGVVVGIVAIGLFLRAQFDLRRHISRLIPIDCGIYHYIRHPSYTAMFLWALAQVLLLQNWLAGPAAALTFAAVYFLRVPLDEQAQLERFGHRYLEYMNRTGSLWPRLPHRDSAR